MSSLITDLIVHGQSSSLYMARVSNELYAYFICILAAQALAPLALSAAICEQCRFVPEMMHNTQSSVEV